MPTVKSLDERIDGLAEDVTAMRVEVAELNHGQATIELRVEENTRKLDRLTEEFAAFRGRIDANIAVARVLVVFVLGMAGTAMFQSFDVARHAGRMEATVIQLQETVRKHDAVIAEQTALLRTMAADIVVIKAKP